jgi:hypothetical protein
MLNRSASRKRPTLATRIACRVSPAPSARHHGRSAGRYQPALAQLGHDVAGPRESSAATVIVFITA